MFGTPISVRAARRAAVAAAAASAAIWAGCTARPQPPVTDVERALFPRAADMAKHFDLRIADPATRETFAIERAWDGSVDVDYEYDGTEAPEGGQALYVHGSLSLQPSRRDARLVHGAVRIGLGIGMRKGEVQSRPVPGLAMGEACEFGVLTSGGENVGNYMIVRTNRHVYALFMAGPACETNAEDWAAFVGPWVTKALAYRVPREDGP